MGVESPAKVDAESPKKPRTAYDMNTSNFGSEVQITPDEILRRTMMQSETIKKSTVIDIEVQERIKLQKTLEDERIKLERLKI